MRNPERIKYIMGLLTQIWEGNPDLRFNQLLHKLQNEYASATNTAYRTLWEREDHFGVIAFAPIKGVDLFYIEDDDFTLFLERELKLL